MGTQGAAQTQGDQPQQAGYVVVERATVPVRQLLTGRAVARSATQLRPRVGGEITEILYAPGETVEAGTPLFTIDPVTYRSALASAEASAARAADCGFGPLPETAHRSTPRSIFQPSPPISIAC